VHHNYEGIAVDYETGTGTVSNNRVFANTSNGIHARGSALTTGNDVYGNDVGILGEPSHYMSFIGTIINNLSYENANQGILIHSGYGAQVTNNTVYMLVGDAVRTDTNSTNVKLRNNILWVLRGFDNFVSAESEIGFDSDYNDLYVTTGGGLNGQVANWEAA